MVLLLAIFRQKIFSFEPHRHFILLLRVYILYINFHKIMSKFNTGFDIVRQWSLADDSYKIAHDPKECCTGERQRELFRMTEEYKHRYSTNFPSRALTLFHFPCDHPALW